MKVSVYDTYVTKDNGTLMHFDILVEENVSTEDVYKYGKEYLTNKKVANTKLTTKECKFCHIENAPEIVEKIIKERGFYIIEMENCI